MCKVSPVLKYFNKLKSIPRNIVSSFKQLDVSFLRFSPQQMSSPWHRTGGLVLLAVYVLIVLQDSFVTEDAMITLRTVDNFVNGYGLRWNINERLQVFTHPLWMFVMSVFYSITREPFYTVLFLSVAVSGFAYFLFYSRLVTNGLSMLVGLSLLLFSQAYVAFSSSGLANPLVHLLVILFAIVWRRTTPANTTPIRLFLLSFLSCLCVLTRMDTGLVFFPALLVLSWNALRRLDRKKMLAALALGYVPFFAWEIFSIIYFGFALPNTYYAKTAHGIPKSEILVQGLFYLKNALIWDPLTLIAILLGVLFAFLRTTRSRFGLTMGIGALLYVLYVVWVGGDHMSGRFLTTPFLCSVIVIATATIAPQVKVILVAVAVIVGLNSEFPPIATDFNKPQCQLDAAQILNEPGCAKNAFSLLSRSREFQYRDNYRALDGYEERVIGRHVIGEGMAGIIGYYAGPEVHIIDPLGLTDPLLARIPMLPIEWRIAHFVRPIPDGYREAIVDEGKIKDPSLSKYYEKLKIITRGDIWSARRFEEIWKFNTGAYNYLIEEYCRHQYKIESCAGLRDLRTANRLRKKQEERAKRSKERGKYPPKK